MKICFAGMLLVCSAATIAVAQPVLEEVERNIRRQIGAPALPAAEADVAPPAGPQPGYLGVVADDRQENGRGIRIREVIVGGPAAKGGLQTGDLITAINGTVIRTLDDMAAILGPLPAGQAVEFQVDRAGGSQKVGVALGVRPAKGDRRFPQFGKLAEDVPGPGAATDRPAIEAPLGAPGGPLLGVRTVPLTIELRRQFKVAADVDGALVTAVTGNSPADRIGLTPGMLITAVNGQAIRGPDTLSALVRQAGPGQEIDLSYRNQNGESHRRVALAGMGAAAPPQPMPQPPQQPSQLPRPVDLSDPTILPGGPVREEPTIQALERRIQQLEARLEKLEAALRGKE